MPKLQKMLGQLLISFGILFLVETFHAVVFQGWEKAENEVVEMKQKLEDAGKQTTKPLC